MSEIGLKKEKMICLFFPIYLILGGTPLNDSLLLIDYILPQRQREMNVNVLNLVVITDGDSNYSGKI